MTKVKQRSGESKRLIKDAERRHDWKRWGHISLNGSGEPSGKTLQSMRPAGTRCLEDCARSRCETGMKQGPR